MFGFSSKYVQFYNPRTKRWIKAKVLSDGRYEIVRTSKKRFKGIEVKSKSKKNK